MSAFILQLSAGTGPDECARAVVLLAAAIAADANELAVTEVHRLDGSQRNCARSISLRVEGEGSGAFCESYGGSVLWRCKSPFRPNHGRKNWFVDVSVFEEPAQLDAQVGDVRIDYFRASGPGGQHVNKTSSAVRLTHLPTGIVVSASEERSQARNKKLAYSRLWNRLRHQNDLAQADAEAERRLAHHHLERGNPIRTYQGPKFKQHK